MLDLAVIIVTWNGCELALQTLRSLYEDLAQCGLQAEVYVVDNGSSDGTPAAISTQFPQVRLLALDQNLGFGGGNNYAMRLLGFGQTNPRASDLPRAVYLLNSDTITQRGATRASFDALVKDDALGLVGARLTYGDGSFQHAAFRFPGLRQLWTEFFPTPGRLIEGSFNGRYSRGAYQRPQPFEADFVLGATMMLKREVINQVGMFDEAFFMYCEEIDWAKRIRDAGWKVACVPAAHVIHLGGQSTSLVKPRSIVDLWSSRLRLFRKYYPAWKLTFARWLVRVGMQRKIHQTQADLQMPEDLKQAVIQALQKVQLMFKENTLTLPG